MSYVISRSETHRLVRAWSQGGNSPSISYANFTYTYYREGTKVKDWKRIISSLPGVGISASSGYTLRVRRFQRQVPFTAYGSSGSGQTDLWGDGYMVPASIQAVPAITPSLENEALGNLISKMQEEITRFQSLPFVREFAQTKQMIGTRANDLYELITATRGKLTRLYYQYKTLRNGFARFIRDGSSAWLEFNFGARPLMSDIRAGFQEIHSGITHYRPVVRSLARSFELGAATDYGGISYVKYAANITVFRVVDIRFCAGLSLDLSVPTRWGASADSIPGAFYEMTPWSWLADYLFDIQTWLSQWQVAKLPRRYFTKSYKQYADHYVHMSNRSPPDPSTRYVFGKALVRNLQYTRVIPSEFPVYVPPLTLAGPFSGTHLWNLSAIAGQRYRPF